MTDRERAGRVLVGYTCVPGTDAQRAIWRDAQRWAAQLLGPLPPHLQAFS